MDNDDQTGIRPIDELNSLSGTVDNVQGLADLKPIFARVEEIAKQNAGATDIELAVKQVKTQLVNRGKRLKEQGAIGTVSQAISFPPVPSSLAARQEMETGAVIPVPTLPSGENPARTSGQSPVFLPGAPPPPPAPPAQPRPTGSFAPTPPPGTQRPTAGVFAVPQPLGAPPAPPSSGLNWKRAMAIGAGIGLVGAVGIIATLVQYARPKPPKPPADTAGLNITTVPPGARILINDEEKCPPWPCNLKLPPGNYRVQAQLEGYDPALSPHTLVAGQPPVEVTIPLTSQAQSLRIFSDIAGKVQIDGKGQNDITEGSFILDRIGPGPHTVTVSGSGADAAFAFDVTPGKAPEIKGLTTAHNLLAVVVSNAGNVARMQASTGPLKAQLDGKDQPPIAATGTDFPSVPNGDHELVLGEGKEQKKIQVSFLGTPTLTAYLRSDIDAGNLVVGTTPPEDDVTVFVNGQAIRKTSRGQVRVQLKPGPVKVRVAKDGFENVGEQAAVVKKGEDTKVEFRLKSLPRVSALRIKAVTSGATVLLDNKELGKVAADGTFSTGSVTPGIHEIEFRMAGYLNKKETREFKAGETVEISNISLQRDVGIISLLLSPPDTKVTYRHENEPERTASGTSIASLVPGRYTLNGRAAGYKDRQATVNVQGGQTSNVDLTLVKDTPVIVTPPPARGGGISDFAPPWAHDGDQYSHAGSPITFGVTPAIGTFHFKVQLIRGGILNKKIRWALGVTGDGKNFTQFELEKNKFRHMVYLNGKQQSKGNGDSPSSDVFDVVIDVTQTKVSTHINGQLVDQVPDAPNLATGKFVFILDKKDEIALTTFSFTPSR